MKSSLRAGSALADISPGPIMFRRRMRTVPTFWKKPANTSPDCVFNGLKGSDVEPCHEEYAIRRRIDGMKKGAIRKI